MIETLSMEELSLKMFEDVKQVKGGNGVMVKHSSTVVVDREDDTPVVVTISVETPDFALDELERKFESASVRLDELRDALKPAKPYSGCKELWKTQTFEDDPVKPRKVYFVRFNPQTFVEELLSEHKCRCGE